MILVQQPEEAGLWRNPRWREGTPGVFALVIGVSNYLHLREDQNSMQMGSLHVSALTAFRFFEWLGSVYRLEGVPIASCRLLVSPTEDELAFEPRLADHNRIPNFDNCSDAILQWFNEMNLLTQQAAEASRSVFFFSGHGLEITEEMQVLLPQDYLRPPVMQYNRAIGTNNLRRGLKGLKVNRHFLFMDACRNDHDNLQQYDPIEGAPILNQPRGQCRNPHSLVPLFFSSAAGRESFQPRNPREGLSLFGSALLEGLSGTGPKLDCDEHRCVINLDPLLGYCKLRIPRIALDSFHQEVEQEVRLSGDYVQDPVTEVTPPRVPPVLGLRPDLPTIGPEDRFSNQPEVPPNWRPDDFRQAHDVFGSERVTDPFINARVFSYVTGTWLPKGDDFIIHAVRYTPNRRIYEVDFSLSQNHLPDSIYWLQLEDQQRTFGVIVPGVHQNVRFQLTLELSQNDVHPEVGHFTRVALNLAEGSEKPYATLARAWNAYRNATLTSATEIILSPESAQDLERVLFEKVEAPLGAAIAGLLLVKGQVWPRLHHWLRNVSFQFPWFADGAALRAEQMLRQHPSEPGARKEALEHLLQLDQRELPILAEVLGMTYSRLLEFADDSELLTGKTRDIMTRLVERYRSAISNARPGGLFTVWAGARNTLSPEMILRYHQHEKQQAKAKSLPNINEAPKVVEAKAEPEKYLEMGN
jgi:hypothetical protein